MHGSLDKNFLDLIIIQEYNFLLTYRDIFFLRDFIFKKTLFEKLQYLKQEQ